MMKKLWTMLAVVLIAASCSSGGPPLLEAPPYTEDDLSAEFLAWATEQIDSQAANAYVETIVNQLNDTPDQSPCFINDTIPDSCADLWQQSLDEWSADCNPPRGATLVVCPQRDDVVNITSSVGANVKVTPTANLIDAANKIEEAHEGVGNVIHHDDGSWDNNGCETRCIEAMSNATVKVGNACFELGDDILNIRTWDNHQTVGHACDAAKYWLGETTPVDNGTHHAEYQLGILRDVLNAQVKARQHPALRSNPNVLVSTTPKDKILDAYHKVFQAHEGMGQVNKDLSKTFWDCSDSCQAAIDSARKKTNDAKAELGDDILNIKTWDNGQTVAHAFWAADYWIGQVDKYEFSQDAKHALYQLGILRDVLAAASK